MSEEKEVKAGIKFAVGGFDMERFTEEKEGKPTKHSISTKDYYKFMEHKGVAKNTFKLIEEAEGELIDAAREVLAADIESNPSLDRRSFKFGRTGKSLEMTPWRQVPDGGFKEGPRTYKDQYGRCAVVSKTSYPVISIEKNENAKAVAARVEKAVAKMAAKAKEQKEVEARMAS